MRVLLNQSLSNTIDSMLTCSLYLMQKDLDFTLKVIGGDMSMVPGLSDSIDVRELYQFLCNTKLLVVDMPDMFKS